MSETLELATVQSGPVAARDPDLNIGGMIDAIVKQGVTAENAKVAESFVALYERMEARKAEKAFAQAFNSLQAEMPKIQAKKAVPDKYGNTKYCYAPYEEIMEKVQPLLLKHGFAVTFSQDFAEGRMIQCCTLQHVEGHSRTNKFAVRVGSGPPGSSECQADGAASTYSKRFALCNALNITIETDSDARLEGDTETVTAEVAFELERRAKETNSNIPAFLKFAGAKSFAEIRASKYDDLDEMLRRKERGSR